MTRSMQWLGSASALALALTPALAAAAPVGTAANADITNTVSVSYKVGTIDQTAVTASDTFKVDRKIDLVVTTQESAAVSVSPGQTNAVTRFLVTNNSNATIDFLLAATQQTGGAGKFSGTDNFSIAALNVHVFVETNGTAGWQASDTQATSLAAVASGDAVTVYVVSDIPLGQANGDIATQILTATAATGVTASTGYAGTGGSILGQTAAGTANGKTTMETVWADAQAEALTLDGLKDGKHAARADYRVTAAALAVAKYSRIVSDPFSGAASPRAIPGALVEYCIVISNAAGATTADAVIASDAIPATLTYVANTVFLNGTFNGTDTCTNTGGTAGNDGTNLSGSTVSNNFGSVAAGVTRTLRFQATIK